MKYTLSALLVLSTVTTFSQCEDFTFGATVLNPWCHDSDEGAITLEAEGGTPAYTYEIRNDLDELLNDFGSNEATGLVAGEYSIFIVDEMGCELDETINVSAPEALHFVEFEGLDGSPGDFCSLWMAGGGGTGSIHYLWTLLENPDFSSMSSSIGVVETGCYVGTITDDYGCSLSDTVCVGWLGLGDLKNMRFNAYYSSVDNVLVVEASESIGLRLFSLDGRLLFDGQLDSGENKIYNSRLKNLILYQVTSENGEVYAGKIYVNG